MKRGGVIAVIVLLVVTGVLWFARGRRLGTAPSGDSVIVALRVDGGFETTIERGEPLELEVFLQGRTNAASATLGSAATPWHRLVTLRHDPDVALKGAVVLGPPRLMGIVLDRGKASLLADEDASIARIVGRQRTYAVALGLSPQFTATLPAGRRTIRADIGAITSSPVSVIVKEPTPERELDRLRRSASFSVRAGDYEEARKIAVSVLARQPDDVSANGTLGDALQGLGRPREARAAYLKAVATLRSGRSFYEEPESLFVRIRAVERELRATRR